MTKSPRAAWRAAKRVGFGIQIALGVLVALSLLAAVVIAVAASVLSSHPAHARAPGPTVVLPTIGPPPTSAPTPAPATTAPHSPAQAVRRYKKQLFQTCLLVEFNQQQSQYPALWNTCRLTFPEMFNYSGQP